MLANCMLPLLAHCDWSSSFAGRWICVARSIEDRWHVSMPERVGAVDTLFARLRVSYPEGPILSAFDFPMGLPRRYAENAGISSFSEAIRTFGFGEWAEFYNPATKREEISLRRPFYPARPGGTKMQHLADALGVAAVSDLLRLSDRKTGNRNAACEIFWTLGANQVGRAAICGWRDMLTPALMADEIVLWPYDGELPDLLNAGKIIVAESYPAETYAHVGLARSFGKTTVAGRRSQAGRILSWCSGHGVVFEAGVEAEIGGGFGDDHAFDSFIGILGLIEVMGELEGFGAPMDRVIRTVEGWILGMREAV